MSRSEFQFIDSLRQRFGVEIGDDAAIFSSTAGKETVITTDLLVEDIEADMLVGIEQGWYQREIGMAAYQLERKLNDGRHRITGV